MDPLLNFLLTRVIDLNRVAEAAVAAAKEAAVAEIQRQIAAGAGAAAAPVAAGAGAAHPIVPAPAEPNVLPFRPSAKPKAGKPAAKTAPRTPVSGAVPAPEELGAKRTRIQLAKTADAVWEVIKAEPDILPEAIAKKLGVRSRDITLPLAILRGETGEKKRVKWKGTKRFTYYTALG